MHKMLNHELIVTHHFFFKGWYQNLIIGKSAESRNHLNSDFLAKWSWLQALKKKHIMPQSKRNSRKETNSLTFLSLEKVAKPLLRLSNPYTALHKKNIRWTVMDGGGSVMVLGSLLETKEILKNIRPWVYALKLKHTRVIQQRQWSNSIPASPPLNS